MRTTAWLLPAATIAGLLIIAAPAHAGGFRFSVGYNSGGSCDNYRSYRGHRPVVRHHAPRASHRVYRHRVYRHEAPRRTVRVVRSYRHAAPRKYYDRDCAPRRSYHHYRAPVRRPYYDRRDYNRYHNRNYAYSRASSGYSSNRSRSYVKVRYYRGGSCR
jgi:hypothetical protein